mgnify:CR=1 FL=1
MILWIIMSKVKYGIMIEQRAVDLGIIMSKGHRSRDHDEQGTINFLLKAPPNMAVESPPIVTPVKSPSAPMFTPEKLGGMLQLFFCCSICEPPPPRYAGMGCGAAKASDMGFVCFVVINPCVLSANKADFGLFCYKFSNFTPPPQVCSECH